MTALRALSLSLLAAVLALAGCSSVNDATMRVSASPAQAVAVVGGTLLTGQALIYVDRSGTLNLDSASGPPLKCMGTLRYTATHSGVALLRCSNGEEVRMNFNAVRETTGYGIGHGTSGPASFAFGLDPAEASAYLTLPPGKRLVHTMENGTRLESLP